MAEREKRRHKRKQLRLKAYAVGAGDRRVFESIDVSASGVYFLGDPGLQPGAELWVRVELTVEDAGIEKVYPVDTKVRVVRTSRDAHGRMLGFGALWVMATSRGEEMLLRAFLVNILGVGAGYIQTVKPGYPQATPLYLYTFVPLAAPGEEGQEAETSAKSGSESIEGPTKTAGPGDTEREVARRKRRGPLRTEIYTVLPIIYQAQGGEYQGTATRVRPHGMRVVTSGPLPQPYQRTTVKLVTGKTREDRAEPLALVGSVVTVLQGKGGEEGSFEIEFSLGNPPHILSEYRSLIETLADQAAQTRGL